jgi:5-methylcytosine-specific restriction endonuclease McrA
MANKINDGLTRNQRYYRKHNGKERSRLAVAAWRSAHPGANREACRRYYAENRDRLLESKRRYYQEVRKPADNMPEGRTRDSLKKSQRRAGVAATVSPQEWQAICQRYGNRCAYCGKSKPLEQDHVRPLSRGGTHEVGNIVPACKSCNASKGNRLRSLV